METSAPAVQTNEPPTTYAHSTRWIALIVLLVVLGPIVSLNAPVWLAPPNVSYTILIYIPVVFAWLILLIVLRVKHLIRFSVLGKFLITVITLGETVLILLAWTLLSFKCSPATITDGLAHYSCEATIQSLVPATDYSGNVVQTWQFQGLPNSPVVSLTHVGK